LNFSKYQISSKLTEQWNNHHLLYSLQFSEHESKLRKLAKAQDSDDVDMDVELDIIKTNALADADMKSRSVDLRADSKGSSSSSVHSGSKALDVKAGISSSHSSSRPAWALSQDVAVAVLEEKEVDDEEALLSFAEDLDFDRCMVDMEEDGVIERLSLRITAMEKEAALEEQREEEYQRRAEKKKELHSMVPSYFLPFFFLYMYSANSKFLIHLHISSNGLFNGIQTNDALIRRNEIMATSSVRFFDEEEKSAQSDMSVVHQYSGAVAVRKSLKMDDSKEGVTGGSHVLHHVSRYALQYAVTNTPLTACY
jgi:hypothetical protein